MKNISLTNIINSNSPRANYIKAVLSAATLVTLIASLQVFKGSGPQLDVIDSLQKSPFARGMFADIGALSTAAALWIIVSSKLKIRYLFAAAVLFVGSFALFPYLIIYFIYKANAKSK